MPILYPCEDFQIRLGILQDSLTALEDVFQNEDLTPQQKGDIHQEIERLKVKVKDAREDLEFCQITLPNRRFRILGVEQTQAIQFFNFNGYKAADLLQIILS